MNDAIPGMNDLSISILCIFAAISGAVIYAMFRSIRHERSWRAAGRDPESSPFLSGALIALLAIGSWLIVFPRDIPVRVADRITTSPAIVSLKDCPSPAPGLTDTIVMVIKSQADLQPTVTGCSRIAERQFQRRNKPLMAEAKR